MAASEVCPVMPNLAVLPGLPKDADGAVFAAPWEAKAFALVVQLHQKGCFEWTEWAQFLAAEIAAEGARNTPYYLLWLSAAEKLFAARGLVSGTELSAARAELVAAQASSAEHDHEGDHDHHDHHH